MMVSHQVTLASLKEKCNPPFKVTEQKYTNIDDHPSVYTTLQQPSEDDGKQNNNI